MKLGKFIATLGIGAALGMLFAPKKGEELREELKAKSKDALDQVQNMNQEDFKKLIDDTIDNVKKTIDEFDVDEFKDTTLKKLNETKDKLEEVATNVQDSDTYAKIKDVVNEKGKIVSDKIEEVKTQLTDTDFSDMTDINDEIDDIDDELDVILDDLKN